MKGFRDFRFVCLNARNIRLFRAARFLLPVVNFCITVACAIEHL
jgi:hypothetical protein